MLVGCVCVHIHTQRYDSSHRPSHTHIHTETATQQHDSSHQNLPQTNTGKKAQSVGAQLRRHGEQQTREDVKAILAEWGEALGGCDLIFVSVPKAMRCVFFTCCVCIHTYTDLTDPPPHPPVPHPPNPPTNLNQ